MRTINFDEERLKACPFRDISDVPDWCDACIDSNGDDALPQECELVHEYILETIFDL